MTSLVLIPTGGTSTATGQFHGHFKIYLHIRPSAHFSIYFTLKTHLPYKHCNISIQTLLHTLIVPTQLTIYLSKLMMPPLYLGYEISHPLSWISYFTTTSFITPLSRYQALNYPLYSNISASILSLPCNYITQPMSENTSLLICIPFTSIINMTKWAYPIINFPTFTLTLKFPWIILNALMYPSHTILTARDYSFMKFYSILQDERIITLAYLASSTF